MMDPTPIDCDQFVELVTDYLEHALDDQTRARLEAHLDECDGCLNYLQQMTTTVALLGKIQADGVDPQIRQRLLNAIASWTGGE
jgi:predicted anti-sigma-YlaC factor YlaD